jgi:hypothetical protein
MTSLVTSSSDAAVGDLSVGADGLGGLAADLLLGWRSDFPFLRGDILIPGLRQCVEEDWRMTII